MHEPADDRLRSAMAAMERLHEVGTRLRAAPDVGAALEETLDASMSLVAADKGTAQIYNAATDMLELRAHRGFDDALLEPFRTLPRDHHTTCARALRAEERIVVEDFEIRSPDDPHRDAAAVLGYRAGQSTPLTASSGEIMGMITTYWRRPHRPLPWQFGVLDLLARQAADFIERKRREEALLAANARLDALIRRLPVGITLTDESGRVLLMNPVALRLHGFTSTGRITRDLADYQASFEVRTLDGERIEPEQWPIARALRGDFARDCQVRLRLPSGSERVLLCDFVPVAGEDGRRQVMAVVQDITARKQQESRLRTLMGELNHRVKNTLAVIQAMARQTMRRAPDMESFMTAFDTRLQSIAKAHSLLTATEWSGALLRDVIASEVTARAGSELQVRVTGPAVLLPPRTALAMHMLIHELATNACKYGGLRSDDGLVEIRWELGGPDEDELTLEWTERCAGDIDEPAADGFGSRLIRHVVEFEMQGTLERTFAKRGLECRIRLPLSSRAEAVDDVAGSAGFDKPIVDVIIPASDGALERGGAAKQN